jgi:hypothetical protein
VEDDMLFMVSWDFIDTSETGEKASLQLFARWQPPAGADFQAFYGFADTSGGFAIIEADDAAALAEATAPFVPWLRFTAKPILPIEQSTAIVGAAIAFREGGS